MTQEIEIKNAGLVEAVERKDLGDILKPLVKEIHLFDTFIAGTSHLEDEMPLEALAVGDRLTLRRETDNRFDDKAILVLDEQGRKLGYVPEKDNIIFSRLLDAGKLLIGRVAKIERLKGFAKVAIGIWLVDY